MALRSGGLRQALAAILALAAGARLAVMVPVLRRPPDDPDHYLVLARGVAEGKGFVLHGDRTAYRPPLYPMALVPVVAMLGDRSTPGVLVLNLAIGLGTVALTALAALRWGLPPLRISAAALVVALDPVLVVQGRSVMTETLAALLLAATLAALAGRRGAVWGGVGFGLLALCRPSLLPAAGLTALGILALGPGDLRARLIRAATLGVMTVATLAPWAIRNARIFGEPVWTTTHGGYTLLLANNPVYYDEVLDGPPGAVWTGPGQQRWQERIVRESSGLTEPQADRVLARRGLRMLAERPRAFARASMARLGRFWGLAPSGAIYPRPLRVATAMWTAPLWLALAVGLARRDAWRWPRVAAPASILALTAVHAVFWTDMRMRAPIVPAIALIVAGGGWRTPGPGRAGAVADLPTNEGAGRQHDQNTGLPPSRRGS